jgi:hypothetical protein
METGSNFTDSEFRRASSRELTPSEWALADWWRWQVLQPLRNELGRIAISSYVRDFKPRTTTRETGPHKDGNAVDVVPLDVGIQELADRAAATVLAGGIVRQVINERDHIHISRILVPGATPGYLHEPEEGVYNALAFPAPPPAGIGALVVAIGAGWIVREFL